MMGENFRLSDEIQNMRFMVQDKASLIKRLEWTIERERQDKAENAQGDLSGTMNKSPSKPAPAARPS